MSEDQQKFETWAVVEIMGHKRHAGAVTEQQVAGDTFLRIDVPATKSSEAYTKLYGAAAIFSITPTTEETARLAAAHIERYNDPLPVHLPTERQLPAGVVDGDWEEDDDDRPLEF